MRKRVFIRTLVATALAVPLSVVAPAQPRPGPRDAGGYPAPTAKLERGRAVYVLSSCHFCHGVDLTGAAMGAADLMHLPLVGSDEDGNLIGPIVRAGLPNLQTAMPQYPDYTSQQISDLAAYVHYLRQQGRYRELTAMTNDGSGDAKAGEAYFAGAARCNTCHSVTGDLVGIGTKYDQARLRARLLRPSADNAVAGEGTSAGLNAHLRLLERYSDSDVRNLLAYLQTLKPRGISQ